MSYYDHYKKYINQNGAPQQASQPHAPQQASQPVFSPPPQQNNGFDPKPPKKGGRAKGAAIVTACLLGGLAIGGIIGHNVSSGNQTLSNSWSDDQIFDATTDSANPFDSESTIPPAGDKAFSIEEFTRRLDSKNRTAKTANEIYKEVSPSIVTVSSHYVVQQGSRTANATGSGSGIILSDEGYILTNNHVVESADTIKVTTEDGEEHEATLVGRDTRTDLAVLRFHNQDKKYLAAPLGNSADVEVGEMVVAIGNPLGELANTLTIGAVSAVDRTVEMDNGSMNFIQTTAAISPGNSGGALINSYGEIIGVTTAKSMGSGVEGIGYAIPINEAKVVVEELIQNGYVTGRPLIGINGTPVTEDLAQVYNMPEGLYITAVGKDSAAEKAGLKVGDIIVSVDGHEVKTVDDVNTIKNEKKPGDVLVLDIYRKASRSQVNLTLAEEKPAQPQEQAEEPAQPEATPFNPFEQNGRNGESVPFSGDDAMDEFFREFFGY